MAIRLEELEQLRKTDKKVSPAILNASETLARIEDGLAVGEIKPLFRLPDVWRILGGNNANSAQAKRAQRDLQNLVVMGKL